MHSRGTVTPRARVYGTALVCVIGLALALGWDQLQLITGWGLPERSGAPMLIVAHRGNIERFPEDSAAAIWDAAHAGADGIEFDVHQSADGTWWVIHDASVDRTTSGNGMVHEMTDAEMGELWIDGGAGFFPGRQRMQPPTLAVVLDGLAGYEGRVFVDLQHAVQADPVDLVEHVGHLDVTVICRTLEDARLVKKANSSVQTLLRLDKIEDDTAVDMAFLEAVSEATVGRVSEQTLPVATYTAAERYPHLTQYVVLRRAWAAGVDVYLARHLDAAMRQRDVLDRSGQEHP